LSVCGPSLAVLNGCKGSLVINLKLPVLFSREAPEEVSSANLVLVNEIVFYKFCIDINDTVGEEKALLAF